MFERTGLPREPQKSHLAEYIWNLIQITPEIPSKTYYVLDGGSLIHRLPWTKGATVESICMSYVSYVNNHYEDAVVVFDGYPSGPTTKDVAHIRRAKGVRSAKVNFNDETPIRTKKEEFLSNPSNKQLFINTLGKKLQDSEVQVIHAEEDADLRIVLTAIEISEQHTTTVIGEDTDLLVLLCYHAKDTNNTIYFRSEPKQNTQKIKIWNITEARQKLGIYVCNILPFIHAFSGCDTTSRIFGLGKGTAMKKISTNMQLQDYTDVFCKDSSVESVHRAGEQIFVALFGGLKEVETLDMLRYRIFVSKVCVGNIYVEVHTLPPTSDAASYIV